MTITPDQKEGHRHRERSREMEAMLFVQSLPPSGDGCSHPGMPWAAILEVCALVFTVRSCANYVYGVLEREKGIVHTFIRGEAGGLQQIP